MHGFRRNTVASYQENLKLARKEAKYDLCEIWNAIFYLVKTGGQWRMLPSDFVPWELVYYYYHKWCSLGEFDLLLNNLREKVRVKMGQKAEASLGIMDSQSVRWVIIVLSAALMGIRI